MSLIPPRFLVRVQYPCPFVLDMPLTEGDVLLELPEAARLDPFVNSEAETKTFADVRLAWNASGMGLQLEVRGKSQRPIGDPAKPRSSDGITLWLDTRGDRTSHRASRYCHQFHFLPAASGKDRDEPILVQSKIHRASTDAPFADSSEVLIHADRVRGGYRLEAFLPGAALNGFDPDEHHRLGVFYSVRDFELGEQTLGIGPDFPFHEDPSLWSTLELVRPV